LPDHSFWFYLFAFLGIIPSRYFLIAGGIYWACYTAGGQALSKTLLEKTIVGKNALGKTIVREFFVSRSLRRSPPSPQSIQKDVELSLLSAVIFAFAAAAIMVAYDQGLTRLYTDLDRDGLGYLGASFGLVLLLQDAYFYIVHRLFHRPLLFRWVHRGHHRSGDPTPWTSFAFDPAEAIAQALFFVGIVFVMPLHFIALIAVLMTMSVWSVWNHLGFELFPAAFARHWFSKWLIGPTHHSIHHRKYTVHYGLYFTFWDKLFGTQDAQYENEFDGALQPSRGEVLQRD
jgi:sterol desaturase/sphingolipid hydroxylase (fatty acid hydroxylase superfamily)